MPSWSLTRRQSCDLELLSSGAFAPLGGFMGREDHDSVVREMRLGDGTVWPIPIVLDVEAGVAREATDAGRLDLLDPEGAPVATFDVEGSWKPDLHDEARQVYGTTDPAHPGVAHLLGRGELRCLEGRLHVVEAPLHHDFRRLRHTPTELRALFARWGWDQVAAFHTRHPIHRAQYEAARLAAHEVEANLLVHPVVGETRHDDIDPYTRVRCYEALFRTVPQQSTALSLLPLAMRFAGPREALWHAIVRRNFGATHFMVGHHHGGPGSNVPGGPFYGPTDAQELVAEHADEVGIQCLPLEPMVYVEDLAQHVPVSQVPRDSIVHHLPAPELRRRLDLGLPLPTWFTFPGVVDALRQGYPDRSRQGFTVFFTGLSGAGKSTLAKALQARFLERGDRPVTLLDGDIVRRNLSSELGFSRRHRDLNVERIGFVAAEITKNRGIAICAPIAPYDATRKQVRAAVSRGGGFFLVHVATPLEVCERRDRKGLYEKARKGIIKEFTGISDPYEEPKDADLILDTSTMEPDEAVQHIMVHLEREGYVA